MGILLDGLYALGLVGTSPVWLYRMVRHGRYREDLGQRFGAVPVRYGLQPTIWVHAVSLGEVNAARTLVRELHGQLPDFRVVISTTTDTGMAAARRLYSPDHMVFRFPLDFTFAVRRAISRIRPAIVVLMEGEIWPNFLAACNRRDVPVVVVNGRMSADRGYPGYKRLGPVAGRLFNRLTAIGVQDESYAERFRSLGTRPEKLHVTGMMKFDTAEIADRLDGQDELAAAMGVSEEDRLIVAGGTGPGEEAMLLDVYGQLRQKHGAARLAIVPRKPERFEEAAKLTSARGFKVVRRSECSDDDARLASKAGHPASAGPRAATASLPLRGERDAVLLGDTMGELRKFYALAACIFVGRSLVPMGGSDMIEAAALGKPACFGPHTFNFPQADALAEHGCERVADPAGLERQLDAWLSDPSAAREAGRRAQQYVRSQQGASRRNVEMICRVLGRVPAASSGGIATDQVPKTGSI